MLRPVFLAVVFTLIIFSIMWILDQTRQNQQPTIKCVNLTNCLSSRLSQSWTFLRITLVSESENKLYQTVLQKTTNNDPPMKMENYFSERGKLDPISYEMGVDYNEENMKNSLSEEHSDISGKIDQNKEEYSQSTITLNKSSVNNKYVARKKYIMGKQNLEYRRIGRKLLSEKNIDPDASIKGYQQNFSGKASLNSMKEIWLQNIDRTGYVKGDENHKKFPRIEKSVVLETDGEHANMSERNQQEGITNVLEEDWLQNTAGNEHKLVRREENLDDRRNFQKTPPSPDIEDNLHYVEHKDEISHSNREYSGNPVKLNISPEHSQNHQEKNRKEELRVSNNDGVVANMSGRSETNDIHDQISQNNDNIPVEPQEIKNQLPHVSNSKYQTNELPKIEKKVVYDQNSRNKEISRYQTSHDVEDHSRFISDSNYQTSEFAPPNTEKDFRKYNSRNKDAIRHRESQEVKDQSQDISDTKLRTNELIQSQTETNHNLLDEDIKKHIESQGVKNKLIHVSDSKFQTNEIMPQKNEMSNVRDQNTNNENIDWRIESQERENLPHVISDSKFKENQIMPTKIETNSIRPSIDRRNENQTFDKIKTQNEPSEIIINDDHENQENKNNYIKNSYSKPTETANFPTPSPDIYTESIESAGRRETKSSDEGLGRNSEETSKSSSRTRNDVQPILPRTNDDELNSGNSRSKPSTNKFRPEKHHRSNSHKRSDTYPTLPHTNGEESGEDYNGRTIPQSVTEKLEDKMKKPGEYSDFSELGSTISGDLASEIVNDILKKVNLTFSTNRHIARALKKGYDKSNIGINEFETSKFKKEDFRTRSEKALKEIRNIVESLISEEIRSKSCNTLPPYLEDFLSWLLSKDGKLRHKNMYTEEGNFIFSLFENHKVNKEDSSTFDNDNQLHETCITDVVRGIHDINALLSEYNEMSGSEQSELQTVYRKLKQQLKGLKQAGCESEQPQSMAPPLPELKYTNYEDKKLIDDQLEKLGFNPRNPTSEPTAEYRNLAKTIEAFRKKRSKSYPRTRKDHIQQFLKHVFKVESDMEKLHPGESLSENKNSKELH